jgi:hypothetical protein
MDPSALLRDFLFLEIQKNRFSSQVGIFEKFYKKKLFHSLAQQKEAIKPKNQKQRP